MYRRFLNNDDYLGIITQDALSQMTRGVEERFVQAEESAEISIVEHLSENYEIEQELYKGKYIAEYNPKITYPIGVFIYFQGIIHEVIRSINGSKSPAHVDYWEEDRELKSDKEPKIYSQFGTYQANDLAIFNNIQYRCLEPNGWKFGNIRIPMINGWQQKEVEDWLPISYELHDVVRFEDECYTLISLEEFEILLGAISFVSS